MSPKKDETNEFLNSLGIEDLNPGTFAGKWITSKDTEIIESFSPVDGKRIAGVHSTSEADYKTAMAQSRKAFLEWSDLPAPKRGEAIRKIGEDLRKRKKDLGKLVTLEAGKTGSEGEGEVQEMIDIADFAVGLSRQLYGLVIASERPEHRMMEQYVPLGSIGVISSFNFPCSVWSWNSFISAVCGDSVVWKPSSKTPLTAIAVMNGVTKTLEENGFPQIFSLVIGRGEGIGNMLSNDPQIPLVSFTGSVRSGKKVSKMVSERLGKTILELGGNNAAIVTGNTDLDVALKGVAFGALATAGQRCTSTRRAIVHESVYPEFIKKIKRVYDDVAVGDPRNSGTLVGPLIDHSAVENFLNAISTAKEQGGKVLSGGKEIKIKGLDGHYVAPALIESNPEMEICKEETFAPILYVFRYSDFDDAIRIHNGVPQGLSSAIFTKDLRESQLFISARGSDCGILNVNTGTAGAEIGGAFGGEKDTGGGRESGSDAWKIYMRRQTITMNYGKDVPLAQDVEFKV